MQVVLLHALARTSLSMRPLATSLRAAGHHPHVFSYPSRRLPLVELARLVLREVQQRGLDADPLRLSFVGHSMGGLVYRALRLVEPDFACGRSVTLGSPLGGSIVADALRRSAILRMYYGVALDELIAPRTRQLPAFAGETACIAGTKTLRYLPASWVLAARAPGRLNDSTVLVSEAIDPSAHAALQVPVAHPFLPSSDVVQRAVVRFIGTGILES